MPHYDPIILTGIALAIWLVFCIVLQCMNAIRFAVKPSFKSWLVRVLFKRISYLGPGSTFGALRFMKKHGNKWTFKYFYLWCYYKLIKVK